ncbi:hypothetical protein CQW32_28680 [Pseudomonas putida]|nr:hypothetical protein CRM86_02345 [Pseudomonas putida]PJX06944.1 hypothetical protein CQW32_28680 [Pseudomonas putida]QNV64736.1 hypothetical protein F7661_01050 [Pseudomonas sp. CFA]
MTGQNLTECIGGAGRSPNSLLAFDLASKRAVVQATQIATSGGRVEALRREMTGMDARQALRPHGWGLQRVLPGARPERGDPGAQRRGRMMGADGFWSLFATTKRDPP